MRPTRLATLGPRPHKEYTMDYYNQYRGELKLKGFADRSIQSYTRAVRQLQNFYSKSLDEITEAELREYWLCCKEEVRWSNATMRISFSGIKHFYSYVVKRNWPLLREVKLKRDHTLPTVLSVDEVRLILRTLPHGQNRTFYQAVYSLGLRLNEAISLQVGDINSDRMQVHIRRGKGSRHRIIPLPESTLHSLRAYWKTHCNPEWLFPARGRSGKDGHTANRPVAEGTVQGALRRAVTKLGFKKHVHPHTFRHSYATHMIEAGVPVRHVQEYLGHSTLASTMIYLHLTTAGKEESYSRLNQLIRGVVS